MVFVTLCAADIFGVKTNFEFPFPTRPSLLELTRFAETAFSAEIAAKMPAGVPPHTFKVAKIKAHDEDRNKWVDLLSESQLIDFCQLYAFQPENPWHKESPNEIPIACKPPTAGPASAGRGVGGSNNSTTPSSRAPPGYAPSRAPAPGSNTNGALVPRGTAGSNNYPIASNTPFSGGNRPAVDASYDEKVRVIFNEFDIKGLRMLEMEDLKQGFRTLGFEFTTATMNDLFQKGDLNSDGRISFSEFEKFVKLYPIMSDCLFYRSKAFWDEDNLARDVNADKDAAAKAADEAKKAEDARNKAGQEAADAEQAVRDAEDDAKELNDRLRDVAKEAEHAQREKDKAAKEKAERENDLNQARDRERAARQVHGDAARDADKVDRKIQQAAQEAAKADDRVKQLQQALDEAKKAADRAHGNVRNAEKDADQAKARERDAAKGLDAAARDIPRAEEGVRNADANLQNTNGNARDLDDAAREMARDADDAARRRDANDRAARAARDDEARKAAEADKARALADEKDRLAKAKEADFLEAQRQRQQVTAHERALIEQELRLREQRDTLEEKENKLKSEAGTFLAGLRSSLSTGPQGRAYSRDPSGTDYRRGPSNY